MTSTTSTPPQVAGAQARNHAHRLPLRATSTMAGGKLQPSVSGRQSRSDWDNVPDWNGIPAPDAFDENGDLRPWDWEPQAADGTAIEAE